ncbi:hypothetical protein KUCAC02_000709, partial [Chaenocephalus aceratus]
TSNQSEHTATNSLRVSSLCCSVCVTFKKLTGQVEAVNVNKVTLCDLCPRPKYVTPLTSCLSAWFYPGPDSAQGRSPGGSGEEAQQRREQDQHLTARIHHGSASVLVQDGAGGPEYCPVYRVRIKLKPRSYPGRSVPRCRVLVPLIQKKTSA